MVRFVLGAATAVLVAACGGGGGGNDSPPPPPPPPNARLELVAGATGGAGSRDGLYSDARLNGPNGIAVDETGTIFIAEATGNRIRRAASGTGMVATFPATQTGAPGYADGANPLFNAPFALAASGNGTVYVVDFNNHAVRQIDPSGNTTTLAGSPERGYADGAGAAAKFLFPRAIVRDSTGNLFVLDTGNAAIRRVTPGGVVSTLAGNPNTRAVVDGTGTAAGFFIPTAMAIDASGNLYVADNGTIRRVTPFGVVTTIAGVASDVRVVDGPPGTARIGDIEGIAVSADGTIIVAEGAHHVIREIAANGAVSTLAGTLDAPGRADGLGAVARFNHPAGLAINRAGVIYVADLQNHTIRLLTRVGNVTTLIGAPPPYGASDGTGTAARFSTLADLALDAAGNVVIADSNNYALRRLDAAGSVQTIAGVLLSRGTQDGPAGTGRMVGPLAVAADTAGNLYFVDAVISLCIPQPRLCEAYSSAIRRVDAAGTITTIAGVVTASGEEDGTGTAARFRLAWDIAIDAAGNLYVSDLASSTIRRVTPGGVVTTVAGSARNPGYVDGTGSAARFLGPRGIVIDRDGNLLIADGTSMIRKMTPAGVVTTVAGTPTPSDITDGVGTSARFARVDRLAIDSDGNVYATDASTIRKITPAGVVTTIAGTKGQDGFTPGPLPGVVTPRSLVVKGTDLYIGIDSGIAVIRNRP